MHSRYVAALLLAAAGFAFACGPRSTTPMPLATAAVRANAVGTVVAHRPSRRARPHTPVGAVISSALDVRVANEVTFALRIENSGDKSAEFLFPDGRTHDVAVFDDAGKEVWRWSKGRMFTQTVQTRMLSAHDTLQYDERWVRGPARGTYTAVATLRSENHPVTQRVRFTIP